MQKDVPVFNKDGEKVGMLTIESSVIVDFLDVVVRVVATLPLITSSKIEYFDVNDKKVTPPSDIMWGFYYLSQRDRPVHSVWTDDIDAQQISD